MASFQFPKDLELDIQPYILLTALSWKMRGKKTQDPKNVRNVEDSIVLPISNNGVIDAINNNWEEGLGLGAENFKEAFIKNLIGKVADSFGDLGKYIATRRGFTVNDYASLAFSGTEFRTFDFAFNLIPKNIEESEVLRSILKAFKRNSLPSYQGWKILYPNFWNINVVFPEQKQIIEINNCVLTNITVNHFPDEAQTIFKDGSPIKTELSVSFKELDKLDRKNYE